MDTGKDHQNRKGLSHLKYLEYKEKRTHGSIDFPFAYYHVTPQHPRYNMMYHWHMECEIIRILSGELEISLNGKKNKATKGELIFVNSGILHGGLPKNCIYECIVFDIGKALGGIPVYKKEISSILSHEVEIYHHFTSSDPVLQNIMVSMFESMISRKSGYKLFVLGALYQFVGIILMNGYFSSQSQMSKVSKKHLGQFKNVLDYITTQYHLDLTLDDLAVKAGMNSKYFCRYFKEMTQKTPMEYLNHYRIECACEQLAISDKNVTEIAFNCGFNDTSYFIKVFKKYKGVTPGKYLKDLSNP